MSLEQSLLQTQERIVEAELPPETFRNMMLEPLQQLQTALSEVVGDMDQGIRNATSSLEESVLELQERIRTAELPPDAILRNIGPAMEQLRLSLTEYATATATVTESQTRAQVFLTEILRQLVTAHEEAGQVVAGLTGVAGSDGALASVEEKLLGAGESLERLSRRMDSQVHVIEMAGSRALSRLQATGLGDGSETPTARDDQPSEPSSV